MERILTRVNLVFLIVFNCFISVEAATFHVKPDKDNLSIAQAVQKANEGDTILINQGIYLEHEITIDKPLTMIGVNRPVIDGQDKYEILFVKGSQVTIKGITFSNSGTSNYMDLAALKIMNTKDVIIQDCIFENNFFAIFTNNSQNVQYIGNHLISGREKGKASANGIHCWKSNHLIIQDNIIEGHRDGIYLEFVTKSKIENNQSIGNKRYGLHFMFSHDNIFNHNVFSKNGAGVAVMYSKRVEMVHNEFSDNWGRSAYGLLLKEINDSKVDKNLFTKNTIAIFADGANRVLIDSNQFVNNGWSLNINASSADAKITNNNFIGNTFDMATNGNLILKLMAGNYWDKYEGYDLNRDGVGDIPYRPITFYSIIIERNASALMLFRSFFVKLMDKAESLLPNLTPNNIKDDTPSIKRIKL
ncbi:MAG: nitrous oxide reductase family maturation protein NosD [Chitinophagales bacterium]|nr:nitrous oxide reductase family maturation protein NosD [Chitinophagales bacterium]